MVIQADRERAALIAEECNPEFEFLPEYYRAGKLDTAPIAQAFAAHREAHTAEMLGVLHQYVSDLRYPPTGDSIQRRIERAEAVIAKATGAAK